MRRAPIALQSPSLRGCSGLIHKTPLEQLQERLAHESRPADETAVAGTRSTDTSTDRPVTDRPASDQSTATDGNDRVVDHTTDLTSREEDRATSTSARHREI